MPVRPDQEKRAAELGLAPGTTLYIQQTRVGQLVFWCMRGLTKKNGAGYRWVSENSFERDNTIMNTYEYRL